MMKINFHRDTNSNNHVSPTKRAATNIHLHTISNSQDTYKNNRKHAPERCKLTGTSPNHPLYSNYTSHKLNWIYSTFKRLISINEGLKMHISKEFLTKLKKMMYIYDNQWRANP